MKSLSKNTELNHNYCFSPAVVMVANKNQDTGSEFQIQNEDFPALPGSTQTESSGQQENKSLGEFDLF